jgi:hypothetical protein
MKRLIACVLCAGLLPMGLAGCAQKTEVKKQNTVTTPGGSTTTTTTTEQKKTGDNPPPGNP